MALDERIRVFGEDVAEADPHVINDVPGKGGGVRDHVRACSARSATRAASTRRSPKRTSSGARSAGEARSAPCPEIQFFDYVWPAMNQLKSEAATTRWRSNGAFSVPDGRAIPIGGYLPGGAIWHSQCGESIFAHIPGLADRVPVARA
jgi:2-oxoisovalerate dehydrogenase E1 component